MKYGRDQNKNMKRPDNDQPDEEVDELANLAGKRFWFWDFLCRLTNVKF